MVGNMFLQVRHNFIQFARSVIIDTFYVDLKKKTNIIPVAIVNVKIISINPPHDILARNIYTIALQTDLTVDYNLSFWQYA